MISNKKGIEQCVNCEMPMEIHEIDYGKGHKVMKCSACGLYHIYHQGLVGGWRLVKATKEYSKSR